MLQYFVYYVQIKALKTLKLKALYNMYPEII